MKRYWGTLLVCLIGFVIFDHARRNKIKEIGLLQEQLNQYEGQQLELEGIKEDLLLRIESHEDAEWVEQVLMKELGVVPKGYMKVYFKKG